MNVRSIAVSDKYRRLAPDEVAEVAARCEKAWQSPEIPQRQYDSCVKPELEAFRRGEKVAPFDAFRSLLWHILPTTNTRFKLLDVGASSGYYSKVLGTAVVCVDYCACDSSRFFAALAERLYDDAINFFDVADARNLPYSQESFDVVLCGGVLMHCLEYEKVIGECVRVSKQYCIFHRTPVSDEPMSYWLKEAYGVECIEIHFNEAELLAIFDANGLDAIRSVSIADSGQKSYLCEKRLRHHPV